MILIGILEHLRVSASLNPWGLDRTIMVLFFFYWKLVDKNYLRDNDTGSQIETIGFWAYFLLDFCTYYIIWIEPIFFNIFKPWFEESIYLMFFESSDSFRVLKKKKVHIWGVKIFDAISNREKRSKFWKVNSLGSVT